MNILIIDAVVAVITMNSAALSRLNMYMAPFTVISIVELVKVLSIDEQRIINKAIVLLYWIFTWFEYNNVTFTFAHLRCFW